MQNPSCSDPFQGKALISIRDAAAALSICRANVYSLISAGDLVTVRLGRRHLIRVDSVKSYIEACSAMSIDAKESA